jgi:serine/threonine protein kinase
VAGSEPALRLALLRESWIAARLGSPWIGEVIETPLAMRSCLYTAMVHRDIKPDNVALQPDGGLKLIDLGVARLPNFGDFPASAAPGSTAHCTRHPLPRYRAEIRRIFCAEIRCGIADRYTGGNLP